MMWALVAWLYVVGFGIAATGLRWARLSQQRGLTLRDWISAATWPAAPFVVAVEFAIWKLRR